MRSRVPDPTPDLKKQIAAAITKDLIGYAADFGAARIDTNYSMASKVRNGNLRQISLQRLVRMAASFCIETSITLREVEMPRMIKGRRSPEAAAILARDGARASGIRMTVILDEDLMRAAHTATGITSHVELLELALLMLVADSPPAVSP